MGNQELPGLEGRVKPHPQQKPESEILSPTREVGAINYLDETFTHSLKSPKRELC